jgi:hypothetical protein
MHSPASVIAFSAIIDQDEVGRVENGRSGGFKDRAPTPEFMHRCTGLCQLSDATMTGEVLNLWDDKGPMRCPLSKQLSKAWA